MKWYKFINNSSILNNKCFSRKNCTRNVNTKACWSGFGRMGSKNLNSIETQKNNVITDNCLSLIRIIAAFQVMFGHMIEHLELPGNDTILHMTYFLRGVPIFFVISGFLIWFSIQRSKSCIDFLWKRFWRIYPELWVAVAIEIIVLVLLYSGWDVKRLLLFAFGQGSIFQFYTPDCLRGYGTGTPNGALWTIGVIIQFYIIVWAFHKLMEKRKAVTWIIGLAASFAISWLGTVCTYNWIGVEILGKLYDQTFIKYFWLFYIGMLIAEYKDVILPFIIKYWFGLLVVAFCFFLTGWDFFSGYYLGWSLFLTCGLIGFAYRFPQLSINTDISYSLFLYHMIVVNVFVNFDWTRNWLYAILVVLIAITLSYLSTVTIGRWSDKKKKMAQLRS